MLELSKSPINSSSEIGTGLSEADERVVRQVIIAYRAKLVWMLKIPEWSHLFEEGVRELNLPGLRRGISAEAALGALLIEQRFDLLQWVLRRANCRLSSRTGEQLDRMFGVDRLKYLGLDVVLTMREWTALQEGLIFRLKREHKRYKHAQNLLYYSYRYLAERVVSQLGVDLNHKADAIQEGTVALLRAIDKVGDDGRFLAYGMSWIKRYVRNYLLAQKLPVYAPVNIVSEAILSDSQGAQMEEDPIVEREGIGLDSRKALLLDYLRGPAISFDDVSGEGEGILIAETIGDDKGEAPLERISRTDLCGMISRSMGSLTEKQREVLR
ncbi:MAG: hypothetical protein JKY51_04365, partial [Opitutaceae bacterium]|nr:hypothetical protein [Opitutaceae bacterium]